MFPYVPPQVVIARVNIYNLRDSGDSSGWHDKAGTFDTFDISDVTDQINGYAIREGLEPSIYAASCSVIYDSKPPEEFMYTFTVQDFRDAVPVCDVSFDSLA